MRNIFIALAIAIVGLACGAEKNVKQAEKTVPGEGSQSSFTGKVVETTNASSYTYILVDTGSQKIWAAAPRFEVKPGDSVAFANGMAMPNYESKTLKRTFDVVYFTEGVTVNGVAPNNAPSGALPAGHPPVAGAGGEMQMPAGHPAITGGPAKSSVDLSGIKKASGGLTVAEIISDAANLKDKEVKVRAKVVKYNPMIMGKNWIHLRDGSGSEGSNDLLVTSDSPAKVGDTVMVTGKVAINKDFGANYKYPVMIEDGKVTVE